MKFWFCVLIMALSICRLGAQALNEIVHMDYEDENLEFIFDHLSNQYDIEIRYNKSILPEGRHTYIFDAVRISDVLGIICRDNALAFKEYLDDKVIIFPATLINEDDQSHETRLERSTDLPEEEIDTIVIGGPSTALDNDSLFLSGFLLDNRLNEPIVNALVLNLSTGEFDISDDDGSFGVAVINEVNLFQITSITHKTVFANLRVEGTDQWFVPMEVKAHLIDEVVISGQSARSAVVETITGLEELSKREIKQLSSFMGDSDVIKSLLTVAGVSTIGEGVSGFNVRGGSMDQNLILQDGVLLMNPSHVLGFFSTFNPDVVLNTRLNKGHIPAFYGGRISSVLDVDLKEADYEQFKMNGGIGLISSNLSAEIPVISEKSSLLLSGRYANAAWLKNSIDDLDIQNSEAEFNDLNIKYSHRLSTKDKLIASVFRSFDEFQFSKQFGYSWQSRIGNLQYKRLQNQNLSFSLNLGVGELENKQFEPGGSLAFDLTSGMSYSHVNAQVLYEKDMHVIRAGGEWIRYKTSPERLMPINSSQIPNIAVDKEGGREMALFINDQVSFGNDFSIDLGLRLTRFEQLGPATVNEYRENDFYKEDQIIETHIVDEGEVVKSYSAIEPRISARYSIGDNLALKASYNRINQYVHLLSNTTAPTPVDIWQVSNSHLEPMVANNFSLGIFHIPVQDLEYAVDFYYKSINNTIDHKDFADLLLQENLETQILKGRGRAYGVEFSLRKRGRTVSGRASYSYGRSERKTDKTNIETINQGNWFPSNFDQPHVAKLFLNWQLSRRDRIDLNFTFSSGRAITAPTSNYLLQGVIIPGFSERNAVTLPAYHRLDIAYTFTINRRRSVRYRHEVSLGFYNFYGRKNVFSVFYRQRPRTAINALQLSVVGTIIPSISYSFRY